MRRTVAMFMRRNVESDSHTVRSPRPRKIEIARQGGMPNRHAYRILRVKEETWSRS